MVEMAGPVAHVRKFVERHFETIQAPGVAVGLTDRERCLGVITHGHADRAAGRPVVAEDLFQIGSISKSFTAVALLQEHEAGRLDLHAPVAEYLPWFEIGSPYEPITVHHLLTHTSGLPTGRDFTTEALHELWTLRDAEVGFDPGTRFHYSNAGYKALGLVLEAVAKRPWWEAVRERILEPLGMTATDPITTHETRLRSALGHVPPHDDRPWHPDHGLVTAPWVESATADGTICSTAEDMCAYVRMLLNGGRGVMSEASFALLTGRFIEDPEEPGEFYGYGLVTEDVGGHRWVGHAGSTVGFSAWMDMDVEDGVGVIVLANADSNREATVRFALTTLSARARGEPLPEIPERTPLDAVDRADEYAGTYRSEHGELDLGAADGRLLLRHGGEDMPLVRLKAGRFVVPHAGFELFPLSFERENGVVTRVTHGERWWANERYAGPTTFDHPAGRGAVIGHWRAHNPWYSNFRIVARRGALRFIWGWGEEDWELVPLSDGRFRLGAEKWSPRRIRFDSVIGGKATRALLDCAPYYRTFTP